MSPEYELPGLMFPATEPRTWTDLCVSLARATRKGLRWIAYQWVK